MDLNILLSEKSVRKNYNNVRLWCEGINQRNNEDKMNYV